jgi:hypothetical protein
VEKPKEEYRDARLTDREWQLVEMIRTLDYGQLTVTVKAGKPIHVDEIRKSIPLK